MTQDEADLLIAMSKKFTRHVVVSISPGTDQTHQLVGEDQREQFLLDISRGTLRLSKVKYQTRGRDVVVLVRLDIDGGPDTNPDGTQVGRTHLHLFREGYDDKWAFPVDPSQSPGTTDVHNALVGFCRYCNLEDLPPQQGGLL